MGNYKKRYWEKTLKRTSKRNISINIEIISNCQLITDEFHKCFVSIRPQLASNISSSTNHIFYMNTIANSIVIPDILTIEVRNVMLLMKTVLKIGMTFVRI